MLPVLLSVITRALITSDNCFGGIETFEKLSTTNFEPNTVPMAGVLLQQDNVALTRDCINLCRQQQRCTTFFLDYQQYQCLAYVENTKRHRDHLQIVKNINLFEKICLKGISRQEFDHICGNERLWSFERVKDTFLDGFVEKELTNVADREECAKACLIEISFICRSADFDEVKRICRLSKENRRTQPQAFVYVKDSQRDYIENQCAPAGPASCVYTTKMNTNVFSMDSLQFASSVEDCQLQCDREQSFNCRSYGFINNRCMLSSDDEKTIGKHPLTTMKGSMYGERTCVAELCTNGIFTYEKITGHILRSAIVTPVELPQYSSLGVTSWCRASCDMAQLNCPAFTINYKNNRCERLDRNTQGRINDLIVADGESFFEKICLRVPQIMSQCQDKFWAFERVLGYELAPVLYIKTLNFVQSRRDCQEYCLQEREFPCRSALYNDETTECKLSAEDRRTSPGHYYRSRNLKINYLENQCVRIHSSCPYQRTTNAYPTYTDIVETDNVISAEECEKLCNDNRYFLCRSYAFYSSNSQCFLSGDDSVSAGTSFIQHRANIIYYERQCSKLSTLNNQTNNKNDGINDMIDATTDDYPIPLTPLIADRIGETSTLPPSIFTQSPSSYHQPLSTPASSSLSPDIDPNNLNKEVVIINGTLGGIITTKMTRFPESLLPTIAPMITTSPRSMGYPGMDSSMNFNMNNNDNRGRPQSSYDSLQPENIDAMDVRYPMHYSSNKKCAPNARFLFEKVTSFEPIGGHLTLLYTDLQNPGIVTECARRCEHSSLCRAFVIDYFHQTCHGLFENSSVGLLDLRLSMGKDYFEGFCVPNFVNCDKFWPFDRIIDQAVIGARPEDIVRFVTRSECRTRCLEEKKFRCASASYNSFTHECHLYSETRDSGSLTLQFSKGIDFMENQCVIDVKSCRYHSIERDISIVSVTKSVRGTSTFHCEQACDYEREFNCRSYTYLDNPDGSLAPGGNLCLLSSDNRATSHQGSIQFRPRALYAEKDCLYQKNFRTIPSHGDQSNQYHFTESTPMIGPTNYAPEPEGLTARRTDLTTIKPDYVYNSNIINQNRTINGDGNINDYDHKNINVDQRPTFNNMMHLQHIPYRCSPNEYTFEKTFGYDLRYAQRERAPIVSRPGVVNYCKDECIRRGDRCMAFIIEYGKDKNQNCFFLTESASENRNQLNKLMGTTYNEKICLREKTCDNIWTFERIIGYTIDEIADREINSIMFRTACQDLCLAEKNFSCRSLTYDYGRHICRLYRNTRRSKPQSFLKTSDHIDYFENKCTKESSTCQYKNFNDRRINYIDKLTMASTLIDCQRKCDSEYSFHCKSINYNPLTKECSLSNEDSLSMLNEMDDNNINNNFYQTTITEYESGSIYSEKGTCEQVSVQCNQDDMILTLNFDSPFMGRVYTKNNPSECYVTGNGQLQMQFSIPLNSRCGTYQESTSSYVNEVIVQQHSIIMTDNDRTIRVLCSFELSDQTVTLGNVEQQQQLQHRDQFPEQQKTIPIPNGIDVSTNIDGRSNVGRKSSATVVANTAAPPLIQMHILDPSGKDAQVVSLGDDLILKIELKDQNNSPYAIFARNLYARSSNGESLYLIDNNGCPIDSSIFPALQLDPIDHRSLKSKFKAFRFPSTGVVNFEVQIRFCQEYCEPVKCAQMNGHVDSFGRRRRRRRRRSVNNFQELFIRNQPLSSINEQTNQNNLNYYGDNIKKQMNHSNENWTRNNLSTNHHHHASMNMDLINQSLSIESEFSRNRVGFTYPTNNYLYYRHNNSIDQNNNLNNINEFDKIIDDQISSTASSLSNDLKISSDSTLSSSTMIELNANEKTKRSESDDEKVTTSSTISTTTTAAIMMENIHPINTVLPLPTSNKVSEIPLSLAIMVEENNNNNKINDHNNHSKDKDDDENDAIGRNSNNDEKKDKNTHITLQHDDKNNENNNCNNDYDSNTSEHHENHDIYNDNNNNDYDDEQNVIENLDLVINNNDHNDNNNNNQYKHWLIENRRKNNLKYVDLAASTAAIRAVHHQFDNRKNDKIIRKIMSDKNNNNNNNNNLHLICNDYCTNTGIIIFITTLIVTIIHLTLGISVYLYITKLKQSNNNDFSSTNHRQQIKRRNLMFIRNVIGAPANYQINESINEFNNHFSTSSSSSSTSSSSSSSSNVIVPTIFDDNDNDGVFEICNNRNENNDYNDCSSLNDDTLTPNAILNDDLNDVNVKYQITKQNKSNEHQKPLSWFGIDDQQHQQQQQHQKYAKQQQQHTFGSIRSQFSNENIYFSGPREQRFFGINNYQFSNNHQNNNNNNSNSSNNRSTTEQISTIQL